MSATELTAPLAAEIERVLIGGDLAKLTPDQRIQYYNQVCNSVGLNPMTKPFDYLNLNGKTVLYANRNCSDQLRSIKGVSIFKVDEQEIDGLYIVTVYASMKDGRQDADKGAVNIANLKGEGRANAILKAVTKAKRRVTLSICGLGWLDETEVEAIPGAYRVVEDESGHLHAQENTKEAQREYLASKGIGAPMPPVDLPAATKPETIRELAETLDQPSTKTIEMRHAAKKNEAQTILDEAQRDQDAKKGRSGAHGCIPLDKLANWKKLKDEIRYYTGTDDIYRSALKAKGYEHANEIQTQKEATAIWTVLGAERTRLKLRDENLQTLEEAATVIGQRAFADLLGLHGAETIEDALALGGDAWAALIKELTEVADGLKSKS